MPPTATRAVWERRVPCSPYSGSTRWNPGWRELAAHTVSGTPSDCVILADGSLFPEKFDLLVSGINNGANMGLDVLDSGTFGGALRGYFHGIPSMAVSVAGISDVNYEAAARIARSLALSIVG